MEEEPNEDQGRGQRQRRGMERGQLDSPSLITTVNGCTILRESGIDLVER
jgi:hypothetical protein